MGPRDLPLELRSHLGRVVRRAGLDLERDSQRSNADRVREVKVYVLAKIVLADFLKRATVMPKEQPRRVDAISSRRPARSFAAPSNSHPRTIGFGENGVRAQ
jgi:hypothetical protein